jgi:exopolyphosphatase / guanosine-5'-triphosphate,3'-diphosphate pyrophosphatase
MNDTGARQEYLGLMRAVERDLAHVLHVSHLAGQLFDGTAPLHELNANDRQLLEAAACLHDLGHTTARGDLEHHKESARLIRAHPWQHLTPSEIEVVAQLARYHRKSLPGEEHGAFARLAPDDRQRVRTLAALLRIADGLDRRHAQFVANVRVEIELERLLLHLETTDYATHEIRAAALKANLAAEVFHRRIEFKAELVPGDAPKPPA